MVNFWTIVAKKTVGTTGGLVGTHARRRIVITGSSALLALSGCGGLNLPPCAETHKFTVPLVPATTIEFAAPIGVMAPVGGSPLPKGHTGFMLNATAVPVTAPGNITITNIRETTYLASPTRPGYSDYSLEFAVCREVQGHFGHLASLSSELSAQASGGSCSQYDTVDETVRSCVKEVQIAITAGSPLGTAGTAPHSPAVDVGLTDSRVSNFVNPARYGNPRSAVCPWDFFTDALRDGIYDRLGDGVVPITESPRCGSMAIDRNGTAQGRWTRQDAPANGADPTAGDFFVLAPDPYAGQTRAVVSTRIAALDVASLPAFTLQTVGRVNRSPEAITADGLIYCYDTDLAASTWSFLVRLDSASVLRVEKVTHAAGNSVCNAAPATWAFSGSAVPLIR
jgi:hypothetical protein